MNLSESKTALVLAPHPDDGEFSCGATLKKLSENACQIYYAAFSPCEKSLPSGFAKDSLFKELTRAVHILGIPETNILTFQYPVRSFPDHRQEILEDLIKLKKQIQPDLVFLPNSNDIHQDHEVINREGMRAFKHCRMLGYELPWNNFTFTNSCHVVLKKSHIMAKMKALEAYKSQAFRNYHNEEFFFGLAKTRGIQIGEDYAEAFECIRWIF